MGSSLEMSSPCSAADKKPHGRLAMMKRGAEEKSEQIISVLCQSILDNSSAPVLGDEQGEGWGGIGWDSHAGTLRDI